MSEGAEVILHVYDLGTDSAVGKVNQLLGVVGSCLCHTGVEVYAQEWSYGGGDEPGTGVFCVKPGCCLEHTHREALTMGHTSLDKRAVQEVISRMKAEWQLEDYEMLQRNCTHFSNALCLELGVGPVPDRFSNLAQAGQLLEPILERYWHLLRPWGEFAALQKPQSREDWLQHMQQNAGYFQANYLLLTLLFLVLMILDFSKPKRAGIAVLVIAVWLLFVKCGGRDPAWKWEVCGKEISAGSRELIMILGTAVLLFLILGHGLILCGVLALAHAHLHPGAAGAKQCS